MTTLLPYDCWVEVLIYTDLQDVTKLQMTEKAGSFYYTCIKQVALVLMNQTHARMFRLMLSAMQTKIFPKYFECFANYMPRWIDLAFSSITILDIRTWTPTSKSSFIPPASCYVPCLWQTILPQIRQLTLLKISAHFMWLPLGDAFLASTTKSQRTLPMLKELHLFDDDVTLNQIHYDDDNKTTAFDAFRTFDMPSLERLVLSDMNTLQWLNTTHVAQSLASITTLEVLDDRHRPRTSDVPPTLYPNLKKILSPVKIFHLSDDWTHRLGFEEILANVDDPRVCYDVMLFIQYTLDVSGWNDLNVFIDCPALKRISLTSRTPLDLALVPSPMSPKITELLSVGSKQSYHSLSHVFDSVATRDLQNIKLMTPKGPLPITNTLEMSNPSFLTMKKLQIGDYNANAFRSNYTPILASDGTMIDKDARLCPSLPYLEELVLVDSVFNPGFVQTILRAPRLQSLTMRNLGIDAASLASMLQENLCMWPKIMKTVCLGDTQILEEYTTELLRYFVADEAGRSFHTLVVSIQDSRDALMFSGKSQFGHRLTILDVMSTLGGDIGILVVKRPRSHQFPPNPFYSMLRKKFIKSKRRPWVVIYVHEKFNVHDFYKTTKGIELVKNDKCHRLIFDSDAKLMLEAGHVCSRECKHREKKEKLLSPILY